MANFTADIQTLLDGPIYGQPLINRFRTNRLNGRMRMFHSLYKAPAAGVLPAIADRIIWGKIPVGARLLSHLARIDFNTGTAACTLNLGDNTLATRHLAATAITTAGTASPNLAVFSSTCIADVVINSATLVNVKGMGACSVGDLVTGTGIPASTTVTAFDRAAKTVTMSQLATATNAAQTVTSTGSPHEASDDSASIYNAYTAVYDDATLVSVVAGAQIANNQIIALLMPYVLD